MSLLEPPKRKSPLPWVAAAIAVLLFAATGAYLKYVVYRPFTPLESPAGLALGRAVPAFLVEAQDKLHHDGSAEELKARAASVLDKPARDALGDDASDKLVTLLRTTVEIDAAKTPPEELLNRFEKEGYLLEQSLGARGLPLFVDPTLIRFRRSMTPILYTYYVERENELSGPNKRFRSLFVRRLDDLNFRQAAVGYTSPSSTAALVLLDDVERELIEFILPAVAAKDDTLMIDLDSVDPDSPWQKDLRARAAAIVKGAYSNVPGATAAQIEELGDLFFRRRKLVRAWMKALDKQRYKLWIPRRFIPEADYANELVGRIKLDELREWRAIHERLMDKEMIAAFDAITWEQARSVEQHEGQHQLDYERDKIVIPPPVVQMLGYRNADEALDDKYSIYVSNEVSAYLAELSRSPGTAAVVLMSLAQNAFDSDEWGGAYCIAALVVLDGLGKELGLPAEDPSRPAAIDRARLTKRFVAVTERPDADIRAAARRAWESWFGAKLPDLHQEKTTGNLPWRH
ncbi:MAG: hypothetical protein U0441_00855 [Polyangiaceae bacterium]